MKFFWKCLLLPALLLVGLASANAQAPTFDQATTCAGGDGDAPWGPQQVVVDAQGNTYVAGYFRGTVVLGNAILTTTQGDGFVAKLDAAGNYVWAIKMGNNQSARILGLAVDGAGNVYVTGDFDSFSLTFGVSGPTLFNSSANGELFVAKLDGTTRQWLWARRAGGTGYDLGGYIVLNAAGEVYLVCSSDSPTADYGPFTVTATTTASTSYLAKLSPAGTWLWARPAAASGRLNLSSLQVDARGDLYVAGRFTGPAVTCGATTLTTQPVPGSPSAIAGYDAVVGKLNGAGTWRWAVQGDAVTHQNLASASALVLDGQGHLYVGGSYTNTSVRLGSQVFPNASVMYPVPVPAPVTPYTNHRFADAFVARLDTASGGWQWAVRNGDAYEDGVTQLAADAQGRVYAVGTFDVSVRIAPTNLKVAQLDGASGAWGAFQALGNVKVQGLTLDAQSRLHLAGSFYAATATFAPFTLAQDGPGRSTGYVVRRGGGPLAVAPATAGPGRLRVWPNPTHGQPVQVQGVAAGQAVQVLDVLGRSVAQAQMPPAGPLALPLPAHLPAGLYLVRSAGQVQRLVVE